MLAPAGVSSRYEAMVPTVKQKSDRPAAQSTTDLKLRHTRMAERAGKMMRLEMSSAPIIRMPSTTVIAVSTARRLLYSSVLVLVACV